MTESQPAKPTADAPYTLFEASLFLSGTSLADMRAFFILSFSAGVLTLCLTSLFNSGASFSPFREGLYVATILCFLFSSAIAFATVFFHVPVAKGKVNIHWTEDGFLNSVDDYVKEHSFLSGVDVTTAQLRFLHAVAGVCRRKHAGLKWAMAGLPVGAVCFVAAQLIH